MIVVMCDGSSRGNPGPASIGIIIWRRMKGKTRISKPTVRINESIGIGTNNEAEWTALIKAMEYLVKQKWHEEEIYIYTDSQLVANQVNLKWKVKHDKIQKLFDRWTKTVVPNNVLDWNVVWVPRQLIYLADKEAGKSQ